jgi:3-methylfumaryl-CoA hydratase
MSVTADPAQWLGRSEEAWDVVHPRAVAGLAATFDRDDAPSRDGDTLPPGWHWLGFHEVVRLAETGADGHRARGGFLPPVALPRRMWAGNRMRFERPLAVGERLRRVSTVTRVDPKSGKSGRLCFVTVRHEVHGESGLGTVEEHDIVYREAPAPGAATPQPPAPPGDAQFARTVTPTPVLLFRFSALTMNSHRIHYDRDYATGVEGHPGLVFHGPLTMLLLLDLFRRQRPGALVRDVSARATSPLYDHGDITLEGRIDDAEAALWAVGPHAGLSMHANLRFDATPG